jgi:hypothetical protein
MARQAIWLGLPPIGSCSRDKGQCKYYAKERKPVKRSSDDAKREQEEYVRSFHVHFPNVRILDLDDCHLLPLSCLGILINLRALSIYLDWNSDLSLKDLLLHVPRLTHLRLNPVAVNSRPLFEPFSHTGLEYLALDFDMSGFVEEEVTTLVEKWTFPRLKTLRVTGPVTERAEGPIQAFILRHASQLTGLSLAYLTQADYIQQDPVTITDAIWSLCWNTLSVFGISMDHLYPENAFLLTQYKREGTSVIPWTVTIDHFYYFKKHLPSHVIDSLVDLQWSWKVDTFVFTRSWAEIDEDLDNPRYEVVKYGSCAEEFLVELARRVRNARLEDKLRVTLDEFLQARYQL